MPHPDLERLARSKSPVAGSLHALLEQPRRLIVSILCGNELVNIAAAANMTAILVALLGIEAAAWTAAFVMIPLILLLGEVTPKTLAVSNPVWASTRIVAKPISWWVRIVSPLAFLVRIVADRTTTLIVGPERARENILHVEDLRTLIEEGIQSGEITPTERSLVHSLITAGSTEVREIMTPRSEVEERGARAALVVNEFGSVDGVRFPDNKEMKFSRLEFLEGEATGLQAEGRWHPVDEEDDDPEGDATVAIVFWASVWPSNCEAGGRGHQTSSQTIRRSRSRRLQFRWSSTNCY